MSSCPSMKCALAGGAIEKLLIPAGTASSAHNNRESQSLGTSMQPLSIVPASPRPITINFWSVWQDYNHKARFEVICNSDALMIALA